MNFHQNDNPLLGVTIQHPEGCISRNHFSNLIIWGECGVCRAEFMPKITSDKVFDRADALHAALV